MLSFLDTNVVIYALQRIEPGAPNQERKQAIALDLMGRLVRAQEAVMSTQVLGEFFTAITRKGKYPLNQTEAIRAVDSLSKFPVVATDCSLVQAAVRRSDLSRISYYDALIVEAALRAEVSILYTEDMQDGMRYGALELRNPFLP